MAYRLKPGIAKQFTRLVTVLYSGGGYKRVSLLQPFTDEIPGDKNKPPKKIETPAATEAELEQLYKDGHPFIEAYQPEPEKKTIPAERAAAAYSIDEKQTKKIVGVDPKPDEQPGE